jgi:hypothetical protein
VAQQTNTTNIPKAQRLIGVAISVLALWAIPLFPFYQGLSEQNKFFWNIPYAMVISGFSTWILVTKQTLCRVWCASCGFVCLLGFLSIAFTGLPTLTELAIAQLVLPTIAVSGAFIARKGDEAP